MRVVIAAVVAGLAGCSPPAGTAAPVPAPSASVSALPTPRPVASVAPTATSRPAPAPAPEACPDDMELVDVDHCPDTRSLRVKLDCTQPERQGNANNLKICLAFAEGQGCHVPRRRQRFCIDRYEYPSTKGAHPPVMVSAYDAARLCAERGKRMCFESEWTAACEGPGFKPFPYGYARSKNKCNIDNPWINPSLDAVHHHDDAVRGPELMRLDQSVDSGAMETCKSDFGVYDLTGNFDEWVRTEWRRGKSKWAGLKGGGWGHVRNACRPITTSHVAHWSYYFISFRCCKEPLEEALPPLPEDAAPRWMPPDEAAPEHPARRPVDRGFTPPEGATLPNRPPVP